MSETEDLAERLQLLDLHLEEVRHAIFHADSEAMYEEAIGTKTDLLRERQEIVERLEELGLEDPAL